MNGNIKIIKKCQGYTLLELIVVIALLAILLTIAVPGVRIIGRFQEKDELKTFRRDIISAKNKAIMEATIYSLHINKESNCYTIKTGYSKTSSGNIVKTVKFIHWEFYGENNFDNSIRFLTTGAPDKSGTMRIKNKKGKITRLTISPVTGKLNVYND